MSNWWSQVVAAQPRTIHREETSIRTRLNLEPLEPRLAPALRLLGSFEGLGLSDGGGFTPPDTSLAVGPTRVIEAVNSAVGLYDRDGKLLELMSANSFHNQGSGDFIFDPVILYDEYAKRFVVSFLELDEANNQGLLHIAVSNDSNPNNLTTDFTEKVAINLTETVNGDVYWADYPKFGYNQEAWVFTFNMFPFAGGTVHSRVLAIDKSTMLDQNPNTVTSYQSSPASTGGFTMAAAVMHGAPANSPMWFVSTPTNGGSSLTVTKMTNILSPNPTYTYTQVAVDPFVAGPPAVEPGGTELDALGDRVLNAAWANNRLVTAHAVGVGGLPKVAWYEIDTSGTEPVKFQEGLIDPGPNVSTYIPAIEINTSGAIGMTFMQTSKGAGGEFVSMYMTGRQPSLPLGQMETPIRIFAGVTDDGGFRQGDYAGIQVDPIDGSFWGANQFTKGTFTWGTGIGHIALTQPPTILSLAVNPNPVREGQYVTLTGTFSDPDSGPGPYQVVINWGDGTPPETINLPANRFTFSVRHLLVDDKSNSTINAKVTVIDPDLNSDTETVTLIGFNDPPTVQIVGGTTRTVDEGRKITIGTRVRDTSRYDTFTYEWKIMHNGVEIIPDIATGSLSFTPPDDGVYFISLQVTDDDGGKSNIATATVTARNVAPKASSLTNDGAKKPGETVRISFLNVEDAEGDLPDLTYLFDLDGNGTFETVSASPFIDTTFATTGIHTVKGRVMDDDGGVSPIYTTKVTINNNGSGHGGNITTRYIVAGSGASIPNGGGVTAPSVVEVLNLDGTSKYTFSPLDRFYKGGYSVASGDVNGDKIEDIIIAAAGPSNQPGVPFGLGANVFIYDGADGSLLGTLTPYGANYSGGFNLAVGDMNRDGFDDIIIAPAPGVASSTARVVGISGVDRKTQLFSVMPFGSTFKGGVTVAVADVTGDGNPDLIAGMATGGSTVQVHAYNGKTLSAAATKRFNALDTAYKGGVFVAGGDLDGDGRAEIIVGSNTSIGLDSRLRIYSGANYKLSQDLTPYYGYPMGIRVATEDIDGDGNIDLLISPAQTSPMNGVNARVLGLRGSNLQGLLTANLTDTAFNGGIFVG